MACAIVTRAFENYPQSNVSLFFDGAGKWSEIVSRTLGLGNHAANAASLIAQQSGNKAAADKLKGISDTFAAADSALGACRAILPLDYFSGKLIYKRNLEDKSWLRVTESYGIRRCDPNGAIAYQGLISIIIKVLVTAARFLNPVNWLHTQGVYDLGKHSRRICDTMMGLWAAIIALDAVNNIHEYFSIKDNEDIEEDKTTALKKRNLILRTGQDIIDLAALPFDFGYGMTGHPALAITGSIINIAAKGGHLILEAGYPIN